MKAPELMDTASLFEKAKALREEKGLTQGQLAKMLNVTQGAISQAERNPSDRMNALRVQIVEALSGRKVKGPVWYFDDEAA